MILHNWFSQNCFTIVILLCTNLQVHGGTTPDDISKFVEAAEMETTKSAVDTIAFFDEANTTDALGLIKEVMCDRRLNGRPVLEKLKFIAACNPYRK